MNVIEATDLHKSYGDVPAVVGIDLFVAPGEVVAVLGPNGAGKTTTIEMLLGLRSPIPGRRIGLRESSAARRRTRSRRRDVAGHGRAGESHRHGDD